MATDDLATTALRGGMAPHHAERVRAFCSERIYRGRRLLMIVRASNPMSLLWHDPGGSARPKHSGIKAKTNDLGYIIHDGKLYYSDYDLQGVFVDRGRSYEPLFTGCYARTADGPVGEPGLNEFLRVLNQYVCGPGRPKMFVHGAQDDYLVGGTPQLLPKRSEDYLVFEPDGRLHLIQGSRLLMHYYAEHGLPWRYGSPATLTKRRKQMG